MILYYIGGRASHVAVSAVEPGFRNDKLSQIIAADIISSAPPRALLPKWGEEPA